MTTYRLACAVCLLGLAASNAAAQGRESHKQPDPHQLPITKLSPAKLKKDLCLVHYPITTSSPECQAHFDQGLAYYYSYVWMEAARSFETAAQFDPECPMAWWGLSKALEKWPRPQHNEALRKAQQFLPRAGHRETYLIKARLAEKGMLDGVKPENRRKEAAKYLDELLTLYDDDEEGWFCRAQVADGPNAGVPYYKALLRVNPLHPGAHHELIHHYENIRRPALGWPHALGYMKSSPGLPHAFHMQAHLAMRIGKWDKTTDWSLYAIELQDAYHKEMNVKHTEDWQYAHHQETLLQALIHDGRFKEARACRAHCEKLGIYHRNHWFRLHVAERDWEEAEKIINHFKGDKLQTAYYRAVLNLRKGDLERAAPEVNV
ncbi:MAG: hypothetical protein NZO58_11980, partial [Gemmataceae bacterium]|nr:hypothetical protein [Gemmataceae bacterium]